jgi:hypothetical protein
MQVAKKDVIGGTTEVSERFLDCRGTIHAQTLGREAFFEKHAEALLIVEDENGAALEEVGGRLNGFGGNCADIRGSRKRVKLPGGSDGKIDGECRAAGGKPFGLDVPAMLANDRHADAESETGAASRALRGVERVEDARKSFGADANAIILDRDRDAVSGLSEADLDAARLADFANGLFGVGDQIQKNLNELIGVADNTRETGLRAKIHFDAVAAQRMFVELEGTLDESIDVERFFLRRSRAREFQQVLDNARGTPGLAVRELKLALGGVIGSFALAEKVGYAKDSGERIVQLVGHASEHLAHGGKFFGLDELLLETLEIGDIAAGENHTLVLAFCVPEWAEIEANSAPFTLLVAHTNFQ